MDPLVICDCKNDEKSEEAIKLSTTESGILFACARIEAAFYPKFENADKETRRRITDMVSDGFAILEVSVKHSGSLFMYAGRSVGAYAKNSYGNIYTAAGNFILDRLFSEAWGARATEKKLEFNDFLEKNLICISMELVTSVLGDHGERPRADYGVVTAVVDLGQGKPRFYSIPEIITFCHVWRLPSNHVWLFTTGKSATSFFAMYDALWEDGTTTFVCKTLDEIADIAIAGTKDPKEVQGEILEGLVARTVCTESKMNLEKIMTHLKPPLECAGSDLGPNLRELFSGSASDAQALEALVKHIRSPFHLDHPEWQSQSSVHQVPEAFLSDCPDVLTTFLNAHPVDFCTRKLQEMINVMRHTSKIEHATVFKFYRQNIDASISENLQLKLIIHVRNDFAFKCYQEKMRDNPELWPLYRGFFVSINLRKGNVLDGTENTLCSNHISIGCDAGADVMRDFAFAEHGVQLMTKLKFLPYKLRTLLMRNGMSTLYGQGAESYRKYCLSQLRKWGTSPQKKEELMEMLDEWAKYVQAKYKKGEFPSRTYLDEAEPFLKKYATRASKASIKMEPVCCVKGFSLLLDVNVSRSTEDRKPSNNLYCKESCL